MTNSRYLFCPLWYGTRHKVTKIAVNGVNKCGKNEK